MMGEADINSAGVNGFLSYPQDLRRVYAGDHHAVLKLEQKLQILCRNHTQMKKINAHYRKYGTCSGCIGVSDGTAECMDARINSLRSAEKKPFSAAVLASNTAEIRRIKGRIRKLMSQRSPHKVGINFNLE